MAGLQSLSTPTRYCYHSSFRVCKRQTCLSNHYNWPFQGCTFISPLISVCNLSKRLLFSFLVYLNIYIKDLRFVAWCCSGTCLFYMLCHLHDLYLNFYCFSTKVNNITNSSNRVDETIRKNGHINGFNYLNSDIYYANSLFFLRCISQSINSKQLWFK